MSKAEKLTPKEAEKATKDKGATADVVPQAWLDLNLQDLERLFEESFKNQK